jgi:hypothetical protein
MSYLRYLCLFVHSGVQHILCCVFLCLVYRMLPVSVVWPFLVAPSVFSNVYSNRQNLRRKTIQQVICPLTHKKSLKIPKG